MVADDLKDDSLYTYSPYVDVYHLQNVVTVTSPQVQGAMGRLRSAGVAALTRDMGIDASAQRQITQLLGEEAEAMAINDRELPESI